MPFVIDPTGKASGSPQTEAEINAELEALQEEVARQEAELAAAEAEEAFFVEQDRKRHEAAASTAADAPEYGSGSTQQTIESKKGKKDGKDKKNSKGGDEGESKGKGKEGEKGEGYYQSEDREAVEVKERLRFPYPAYSTVAFVKK